MWDQLYGRQYHLLFGATGVGAPRLLYHTAKIAAAFQELDRLPEKIAYGKFKLT